MKTMLQKYVYGLIQYFYYLFGIPLPVVGRVKYMPSVGKIYREAVSPRETVDVESLAFSSSETVLADPVISEVPAVSVSAIEPPVPLPSPVESSTAEPAVTQTAGGDAGLRDDIATIREGVKTQGHQLLGIETAMTAVVDGRRLLEGQEAVIKDLSTRLRQAEENQLTIAITKPFVSGIIQLFDTVWNATQDWAKQRPANVDDWVPNVLATLDGEIMALLNRHGVEMIRDTTDRLDPRKQRVVRTQIVHSIQDGTILTHLNPGFYFNGQVVRPEEVVMAIVKQGGEKK
ncbi:MAG: nucleotide exchange factor GrpE [bacterium]